MERTLKLLLEQAKFTTTRKGYDQQEVDDFLDQAVEMAAAMEARLAEAAGGEVSGAGEGDGAPGRSEAEIQAEVDAKVEAAVQARLAEMPAPVAAPAVDDEAVAEEARRTLVLAQRTADAAVAEAREEADSLLTKAQILWSPLPGPRRLAWRSRPRSSPNNDAERSTPRSRPPAAKPGAAWPPRSAAWRKRETTCAQMCRCWRATQRNSGSSSAAPRLSFSDCSSCA